MSSNYSANQYESSYKSQRLQNWCLAKPCKERPTALEGHSNCIADDRGHLIPGVAKRGSSWPDFKGTWDLPARLHPQRINPTSRSVAGLDRLRAPRVDPKCTSTNLPEEGSKDAHSSNQDDDDAQDISTGPSPRSTPLATHPTPPPPAARLQGAPCCSGGEGPRASQEGRRQETGGGKTDPLW